MKFLTYFFCFILFGSSSAADWPTWRGPNSDGKLSEGGAAFPVEWSPQKNLKWRVELPEPGNSSPIVVGERIFLTLGKEKGASCCLLCFNTKDGSLRWEKEVNYGKVDLTHQTNPYCSASPVSDGERVYAWYGNAGLFAYDLDGKELWKSDLGTDYAHIWGSNAGSPVIHGDAVIISAGPGLAMRLFAVNRQTGATIWQKDLPDAASQKADQFKGSWATPLIIKHENRSQILLGLPGSLRSFDPATGAEIWRCGGLGDLCYTNVMTDQSRAVYLCGYGGPGIAMRLPQAAEAGDLTATHRIWADDGKSRNRQRIGSGQIIDDHLYLVEEPGGMICLDLTTGRKVWEERLGRKSWSSMNLIGDKLYVNDQSGTSFVIKPDRSGLKLLQQNPVDPNQHTNSTPAFSNGLIIQRTDAYLYGFGS